MAKIFEELFTLTQNGIAVIVWYVSSMPVVSDAMLNDWLRRIQTKQRRNPKTVTLDSDTRHGNSIASLKRARVMKSIIYIKMREEKAPIYKSSRSKAPKTQQICHYRHVRKTSERFFLFNTSVDFSLRNNFANSSSCAKVSVPVYSYNSLISPTTPWSCLLN